MRSNDSKFSFCSVRPPGLEPVPTLDELAAQAKEAWRNNARCIGRLFWNSLELLDARTATTAADIFDACVHHLRYSTNGGRIRSAITVFPETWEGERGIRIHNPQLIRYAGYRLGDGSILGDPEQAAFTERVIAHGWTPPARRTPFDVLPLVVELPGEKPVLFQLPGDAVLEIDIIHPEFSWFADLGLKWHALPVISDMALLAGGRRYTAAPFSGYYMGTEIGSRNFGDESRYNMLPIIAGRMGIDNSSRRMLWKDRALVELNTAVLHSYREAGVAIVATTLPPHNSCSTSGMRKRQIVPCQAIGRGWCCHYPDPPAPSSTVTMTVRPKDDLHL